MSVFVEAPFDYMEIFNNALFQMLLICHLRSCLNHHFRTRLPAFPAVNKKLTCEEVAEVEVCSQPCPPHCWRPRPPCPTPRWTGGRPSEVWGVCWLGGGRGASTRGTAAPAGCG